MIGQVFREHWARVLAALVSWTGDLDVAEEAAQEAFAVAAERWPRDGVPADPVAWLVVTGRNRAVDRLRRDRRHAEKLRLLDHPIAGPSAEADMDRSEIPDERLELFFLCCHPALAPEAQVALTLRALGGLSTPQIARAFLVSEETMKRRLSRARHKIRAAGIPFAIPRADLLPGRLAAVLAVLMLLHDSRRAARVRDGEIVLLGEQDRALWDAAQIREGRALLGRAVALGAAGPYAVQAAVADLQTERPIDWPAVAALYGRLRELTGSAVVELNRAVAVAEVEGPGAALAVLDGLPLEDYRYYHSTRADLLRRLHDTEGARAAYRRALELTTTEAERRFLTRRLAEL
ncbi:RNA polymerase sigma factor [Nonomuraea spiralis]|uniref:RNA polymerase sigma factor n=1 Tax=Nonomuraea spiralis TaxID=46182 RepID=A0ABV5IK31_9ACTN|nr:sigma-70 family RNA polymerase sigma factor [Nonomuraea spiralis]GGT02233.1 RNA polymerase subunit sigma-24 [Nonomuraea spiralis]